MKDRIIAFYNRHERTALLLFFVGGFIWDSLTLQRIDHMYSNVVLFTYLICLLISLYIFNCADDGRWEHSRLGAFTEYAPLAVQFFLGGLASAYVVFFFRSVSLTKTMVFLMLLVFLMISNEVFKHRLSNKNLQFGALFFVTFTFFTFIIPVFTGVMNTLTFIISGIVAISITLGFITIVYNQSASTRQEVDFKTITGVILGLYITLNVLYYFNMIPPVPLALQKGLMAYDVQKIEQTYRVTYDPDKTYKIWRSFNPEMTYTAGDSIFAFTSIFAPTNLRKSITHRWKWLNPETDEWVISDNVDYQITGGRDGGYRGYTYKTNLQKGKWQIDVITEEGLILGIINFELHRDSTFSKGELIRQNFD